MWEGCSFWLGGVYFLWMYTVIICSYSVKYFNELIFRLFWGVSSYFRVVAKFYINIIILLYNILN